MQPWSFLLAQNPSFLEDDALSVADCASPRQQQQLMLQTMVRLVHKAIDIRLQLLQSIIC